MYGNIFMQWPEQELQTCPGKPKCSKPIGLARALPEPASRRGTARMAVGKKRLIGASPCGGARGGPRPVPVRAAGTNTIARERPARHRNAYFVAGGGQPRA